MKNLIESLNWRYATKKFDPNKKINQNDLDVLFEVMRLSPSSYGLQPWKFIHVVDPKIREKLKDASWGQEQITQASELIVFSAKNNMQESDIENYVNSIVDTRKISDLSVLSDFKSMMLGTISDKTQEQLKIWNQRQLYIAVGFLLFACAQMGIDACPMEGFDPEKYNEILGLDELGLTATVVVTLGYRSTEDKYADLAKVRFAKEQLIVQK